MINSENVPLIKTLQQNAIQPLRGRAVGAKRFLHDDARSFLGTARSSELLHYRSEQHWRNSEVMRRSLREAEFPTDRLKRRRILVIAIHVTQQAAQFLEGGRVKSPCFSRLSLALALSWS